MSYLIRYWLWIAIPAALGVLGALWNRHAESRETRRGQLPGRLVDIGGRRLHVIERGGGGPTVIMESGGGASSVLWWPLQNRLAAQTTVLTYDRAGLGWSDPAPLPRTIEDRADDLARMLERAGATPPYVLVGLSYGGPVIRVFAARHADRVAGMVFVDIAHEEVFRRPGAQTYLRRFVRLLRTAGILARIGLLRLLRIRGIPTAATALPFSEEQQKILHARYPRAQAFAAGADEFQSMYRIADAMAGLGAPHSLGELPVAVVSHGQPFPGPFAVLEQGHTEGQQALAALSSQGILVVAGNSSHAVPLEQPQVVIEAIEQVLNAARSAERAASREPLTPTTCSPALRETKNKR